MTQFAMEPGDNRKVVLIKSLATNNRFYTLIAPERGIRNADTVDQIPDDLLLGIAYPCLEDGLNDFAVIRTTFETLELFPEDDPIREEMMEIINDARSNLVRRLTELHDKIASKQAHFLGTDYDEFKSYAMDMVHRGYARRNLDSMMKLNVFSSVAQTEGQSADSELLYFYEFKYRSSQQAAQLPPREFIAALFDEVLRSVRDDTNYKSKYFFDRNVFQKFIAVMFVNYATTDPVFYGINRKDYGVSDEKEMDNTPLYLAIHKELREIEQSVFGRGPVGAAPAAPAVAPQQEGFIIPETMQPDQVAQPLKQFSTPEGASLRPGELVNEEALMGPITSLCSAAALLIRKNDPETQRYARFILADASKLVNVLKRLGIVSPIANDPGAIGH
jgi:hypothetical protein